MMEGGKEEGRGSKCEEKRRDLGHLNMLSTPRAGNNRSPQEIETGIPEEWKASFNLAVSSSLSTWYTMYTPGHTSLHTIEASQSIST